MKFNKKHATALFVIGLAVIVSGCVDEGVNQNDEEKLSGDVDTSNVNLGATAITEMRATEANHQRLVQEEPIPSMEDSLERENLIRRYKTLNDQNQEFHVYLMGNDGQVISYFVAQGKVSSLDSKLTHPQQMIPCDRTDGMSRTDDCIVASPQQDGSYGTNGDGIFFFTTNGEYVEWNGKYVVSEVPLGIQTPISLEADVNISQ